MRQKFNLYWLIVLLSIAVIVLSDGMWLVVKSRHATVLAPVGTLPPISIISPVTGKDAVLNNAGGTRTILPKADFVVTVPQQIIDRVKQESGENVSTVTVDMEGFSAGNVTPALEGLKEIHLDIPIAQRRVWSYAITANSSIAVAGGSQNAFTLQLTVRNATFEIYGTCTVEKTGDAGDDTDQVGGAVHWVGPVRVK